MSITTHIPSDKGITKGKQFTVHFPEYQLAEKREMKPADSLNDFQTNSEAR